MCISKKISNFVSSNKTTPSSSHYHQVTTTFRIKHSLFIDTCGFLFVGLLYECHK